MSCIIEEGSGQMAFVSSPTVVIEFDPSNLAYGSPTDLETGYETEWGLFWGCYTAWPRDFPSVVGQGNSEHWAIVDLARELRDRNWPIDNELTPASQLAYAAERLSKQELIVYLRVLSRPAELSGEDGLVLR